MHNKIATGISFSKELLKQIDKDRGDISRSRYITKFFEKKYPAKNKIETADRIQKNKEKKDYINKNKVGLPEGQISSKSANQ